VADFRSYPAGSFLFKTMKTFVVFVKEKNKKKSFCEDKKIKNKG
jgi:hypothetical protein